jgi:pimeloyl-ACP methyl ester carboxylesterase
LSTGKAMRRPKTADTDILYIHGRTDGCMTAQWSASLPPMEHARIEIVEGGGHFVQLEQPAEVYQLISDFIE